LFLLALAIGVPLVADAQESFGFHGWGLRAGASTSPDQFYVGAQLNLGSVARNLRFQPNVDLGSGDGQTILSVAAPFLFRGHVARDITIYGGGGAVLGFINRDRRRARLDHEDTSTTALAPMLAGGLEFPASVGSVALELAVSGGDLPDAKLGLCWMF